jgi:hypothetical protein
VRLYFQICHWEDLYGTYENGAHSRMGVVSNRCRRNCAARKVCVVAEIAGRIAPRHNEMPFCYGKGDLGNQPSNLRCREVLVAQPDGTLYAVSVDSYKL